MPRWLGIDFSGNHAMWSLGCGRSNVWIADVRGDTELNLVDLVRVQKLPGTGHPFDRLVRHVQSRFDGAAIDAPFSVPSNFVLSGHAAMVRAVGSLPFGGRPFPTATQLVTAVAGRSSPLPRPKPLRITEGQWGVSARSTMWAGPRGGAAMTAACLTLLDRAGCPVWPWVTSAPRLLVEAFPAAQLRWWKLPHTSYNGRSSRAAVNRGTIVRALRKRIDLGVHRALVLGNADALDAVICAFAAIAVTKNTVVAVPSGPSHAEGWIAVHP